MKSDTNTSGWQLANRSERRLAAIERLSHTGSWAWNPASRELFWSEETFRIFGFDPLETKIDLSGALARIHPEDLPMVERSLRSREREATPSQIEYRIVLPDGPIRYVRDFVNSISDSAEPPTERQGIVIDVTERKRGEEELRRSLAQSRALADRLHALREEERTRLAREIHDQLGQALTAIKIEVASMGSDLPATGRGTSKLGAVLKRIDNAIHAVRTISTELRPGILDDLGLAAAIEWAAEDFENRTGTWCLVTQPDAELTIDPESATVLFRILQEALTNVARHARATQVQVTLSSEGDAVSLEVADNGVGITEQESSGHGSLGIIGMRERARLLGGEFSVTGGPLRGTSARARIPNRTAKAAGASPDA